jgi:HK97 family phage prohead protease
MTNVRKFLDGDVVADSALGAREIRVIASTQTVDRQGDVIVVDPAACDMRGYLKNPIVLASHDTAHPVGTARPKIVGNRLEATIVFAPAGVSSLADTWCGLTKAGVVRGVSIGFAPIESEPIAGGGYGARKFTRWELLEISLVAVPANAEALVVARSHRGGKSAGADLTNMEHVEEIARHLQAATKCLARANSAHADAEGHLAQMGGWLADGQRHAAALHAAGGLGGGSTDGSEDDADNAELAIEAPRNSQTPAAVMTTETRKAALNRLDRADVGLIYRVGTVAYHAARPLPLPPAAKGGGAHLTVSVLENELKRLRALW